MARSRKHIPLLLALIILAACGKEPREAETFSAVFSVGTSADTKAATDASHINRYILEVYSEDGDVFYDRVEKVVEEGTLDTDLTVTLRDRISYSFVFWADCSEEGEDKFYTTLSEGDHGLRAVSIKGDYCGNDESRAAFSASIVRSAEKSFTEKVTLKHPFARISVMTDDLDILPIESVKPTGAGIKVKACTCLDLVSGALSGEKEISYTAAPYYQIDAEPFVEGYDTLTIDYIFASDDSAVLDAMEFTSTFEGGSSTRTFVNIPYRRNYKTNILGSILTETASYSIVVSPEFEEE